MRVGLACTNRSLGRLLRPSAIVRSWQSGFRACSIGTTRSGRRVDQAGSVMLVLIVGVVQCGLLFESARIVRADEPPLATIDRKRPNGEHFVRVVRDRDGEPAALETSVVRYRLPSRRPGTAGRSEVTVDLVSAVHLGSRRYYDTLDRLFQNYDAVLYELVAPENARVPQPGRKPSGTIGQAQVGLTRLLGLSFQLDEVDYRAANFVHADLTPQQFDEAMRRRGESWWTMFMTLMRESMAKAPPSSSDTVGFGDLFSAMFGDHREIRLRRMMAIQFSDMDVLTSAFGGEKGSTLLSDRNAAAIDVLRREVARGRRNIAIFYGAAHMPDFDVRLRKEFGFEADEAEWIEAWDLRLPAAVTR